MLLLSVALVLATAGAADAPTATPRVSDFERAAQSVHRREHDLAAGTRRRAKNVILFVGDGMGITTVTAARILEGQLQGGQGEDHRLSFEDFEHTALVRTYTANQQTSDSAPTATAMVTGWKANDGALSVDPATGAEEADAAKVAPHRLTTLLELAESRGLSTGVVTTTRITHATPAANYAHTPNRDWENDAQLPPGATLPDIAAQLIERQKTGNGIEVVMGGGRTFMLPAAVSDPEYPDLKGRRKDGRNLTSEWLGAQAGSQFVWNKAQFAAVDPQKVDHLLALFEPSHMRYEADRAQDGAGEPHLAEMTAKAIQILQRNRKGYFLMVEGGRIDHAHHAGNAYRALTETIAFSDAVRAATRIASPDDTLILVTADHSHVFTMAGYPARGNPILGLVKSPDAKDYARDVDGHPYTTLSYANGPGYALLETGGDERSRLPPAPGRHQDLSNIDTTGQGFHQESLVGLRGETHGGEDVALYARGPRAALVRGSIDQNEIYHIMRLALGL
ncbi:MAG: alkaline phosphatase [Pseudomonadota bacterium]